MSDWFSDWWSFLTTPGSKIVGDLVKDAGPYDPLPSQPGESTPWYAPANKGDAPDTTGDVVAAKKFLMIEAAILGGIVAAPFVYRAALGSRKGKRAKADDKLLAELDMSSNRATTLLAALGPAVVFPLTYITVQKMEGAQIISKGLGDAVQSLMTAMAVAPVAGAAVNLVSKAIPGK